jgi:Tfp pilus assembly protein PilO
MMSTWPLATKSATTHAGLHAAGAALTLGVAAAFYNFVYAPMHEDIAVHTERIEKVRALAVHGEIVAQTNRQLARRLKELTQAANEVRERMPAEVSASDFVELSSQLAAALDVQVQQCRSEPPQDREGHATIDVSCELVGSYDSICRYLVAVDQLPQVSRVTHFDLSQSAGDEGYPVHVTFQLYYQAQPNDKDRQRGTL